MGVDVGGTGIKGAIVDLDTGTLVTERHRILTPDPSTPEAVAATVAQIVATARWEGPIGCAIPAVVLRGIVQTAANIHRSWIGADGCKILGEAAGATVSLLNDADAAGLAEMTFGAGRGRRGTVIMLTMGTGIGSAVFVEGHLVPNTELGHLRINGKSAESRASAKAREDDDLSWEKWAKRVNDYLGYVEALLWPDLFIVGGGISKKPEKFMPLLRARAEIVPAQLRNNAGIVGAALASVSDGFTGDS